jgi:hypothetical protein
MSGNGNNQGRNDNKRKYIIIIIAAVVVIAAMAGVIIYLLTQRKAPETSIAPEATEKEKRTVLVTEENAERVAEQMLTADPEEDSEVPVQYTVTMNSKWHFKNAESASDNAYVANNNANTTDVYFDVVRNDTQEVVYSSPVLPVGTDISNFKLDQDLEAGVYECTLIYYLVDKDQNVLTTVNMWVEITVDN